MAAAVDALDRLLKQGDLAGSALAEALRIFADVRTTPDEGRAVELLLTRHVEAPLPESLLVVLGCVLVERGEDQAAERALARAASSPALVLRADLRAREGDVEAATALVERVLLRDIDFPGARERYARWCARLGRSSNARLVPASVGNTMNLGLGNRLEGPFLLLREVARGGSGTVYEAQDRDLARPVGLKIYHRPKRDRAQLVHEARVAAALWGNGVVRVYDVDVERGWLAMQWAPRGALGAHLKAPSDVTLASSSIERWGRSLATALARVHAAGWAHLDVKPANVLLLAGDEAVLSDFGTARRFGESSPPGSFGYLSPERLAGRASDPRDDVYGFGRIVEEALDRTEPTDLEAWRNLAASCTGAEAARPRDGSELLVRIERESAP